MPVSTSHANPQVITAADINALATLANANETAVATKLASTDPSVTNSRAPNGAAGGGLGGTFPNPTVTVVAAGAAGPLSATDTSVTNARTPTAHQASHAAAGSDFINPTEQISTNATSGAAATIPAVTTATYIRLTLTAACTIAFPATTAGTSFTLELIQDATGGRLVTWPGTVKWPAATAPTLTATAAKTDLLTFLCNGTSWFGTVAGLNF